MFEKVNQDFITRLLKGLSEISQKKFKKSDQKVAKIIFESETKRLTMPVGLSPWLILAKFQKV